MNLIDYLLYSDLRRSLARWVKTNNGTPEQWNSECYKQAEQQVNDAHLKDAKAIIDLVYNDYIKAVNGKYPKEKVLN